MMKLSYRKLIVVAACLGVGVSQAADSISSYKKGSYGNSLATQMPVTMINSQSVNINYQLDEQSNRYISRIELWYGQGFQGPWQFYGYDKDLHSPVRFETPTEGIYRFLVVAVDKWGNRSSGTGGSNGDNPGYIPRETPAQQTVFIDYNQPQLYLQKPTFHIDDKGGNVITVHWAGFDSHLNDFPIQLNWQIVGQRQWLPLGPALKSRGSYNWIVPENIRKDLVIKAIIKDRAGNQTTKFTDPINVRQQCAQSVQVKRITSNDNLPAPLRMLKDARDQLADAAPAKKLVTDIKPGDRPGGDRLQKLVKTEAPTSLEIYVRNGRMALEAGQFDRAAKEFEKVLGLDENHHTTRLDLADTLHKLARFQDAKRHYKVFLAAHPDHKIAMYGLSQTLMALNEITEADILLNKIINQNAKMIQDESAKDKPSD